MIAVWGSGSAIGRADDSRARRRAAGDRGRAAGHGRALHAGRDGARARLGRVARAGERARRLHGEGARVHRGSCAGRSDGVVDAAGDIRVNRAPATTANGQRLASTLVPVTQGRDWRVYDWPKRHAAIVALMKARQPEIVMLGDSIMHFWGGEPTGDGIRGRDTAPEVWNSAFAGRSVVNLGYGWDRTENVLWRLRHGEFEGVSPKVVVIMIGTNNVTLNTAEEIAAGVTAIVDEVHQRSRTSRILLLGIFPRGEKPDANRATIDDINQRLAKLDGRDGVVTYLDIGPRFPRRRRLDLEGRDGDFLHPSAKGYEIWVEAMKPTLTRLLSAR